MTINNPDEFVSSLWDWAVLGGCFGDTRIMPTDIDGFVERNGKFLWLETKQAGVDIPTGQMIAFKHAIDTGLFTVLVIWGNPGVPERLLLMTRQTTLEYSQADLPKLRQIVSAWFDWANRTQTPPPSFSKADST